MARITLTTTPAEMLVGNAARKGEADDAGTRTFFVFPPPGTAGGTALLADPVATGTAAGDVDFSDAARFQFGTLGMNYSIEPGKSLFAKVASGTLDLDILPGGER